MTGQGTFGPGLIDPCPVLSPCPVEDMPRQHGTNVTECPACPLDDQRWRSPPSRLLSSRRRFAIVARRVVSHRVQQKPQRTQPPLSCEELSSFRCVLRRFLRTKTACALWFFAHRGLYGSCSHARSLHRVSPSREMADRTVARGRRVAGFPRREVWRPSRCGLSALASACPGGVEGFIPGRAVAAVKACREGGRAGDVGPRQSPRNARRPHGPDGVVR